MSGGKPYMKNTDAAAVQNRLKQQKERLVDDALQIKAPRSFVVSHGHINPKFKKLVADFRRVMEPFTASKLEEKKNNSLKDFLAMASFFHVTHLITLTESALDTPYLRMCRLPQGPTLSFKVHQYSLMKDIHKMYKKQVNHSQSFTHSPLVIMNGFTNEPHSQLMTTMFQNMFPTFSVKTMKLSECKRVVMFSYDKEKKIVKMRHYSVMVNNSGVNKAVRKLAKPAKSVNLRNFNSAGDFILSGGAGAVSSDSELDETGISTVAPQTLTNSIQENSVVNIRLREMGPRLDMELVKIEDGFFDGKVIYHAYSIRTPQEEAAAALRKQQEKALKDRRRAEQEENVKRKLDKKAAKKNGKAKEEEADGEGEETTITDLPEIDDDEEYYRQEVGEEPDEQFKTMAKRTKKPRPEPEPEIKSKSKSGKSGKSPKSDKSAKSPSSSKKNKKSSDDGPKKKKSRN